MTPVALRRPGVAAAALVEGVAVSQGAVLLSSDGAVTLVPLIGRGKLGDHELEAPCNP